MTGSRLDNHHIANLDILARLVAEKGLAGVFEADFIYVGAASVVGALEVVSRTKLAAARTVSAIRLPRLLVFPDDTAPEAIVFNSFVIHPNPMSY